MVRLPGLASTIKSGGARTTSSSALWLTELVVAFTLIVYWPRVVVKLAETVTRAFAVLSAVSETLLGLSVILGGCIVLKGCVVLKVGTEEVRLIVSANPLRLVMSSLKLVDSPRRITADDSEDASKE